MLLLVGEELCISEKFLEKPRNFYTQALVHKPSGCAQGLCTEEERKFDTQEVMHSAQGLCITGLSYNRELILD